MFSLRNIYTHTYTQTCIHTQMFPLPKKVKSKNALISNQYLTKNVSHLLYTNVWTSLLKQTICCILYPMEYTEIFLHIFYIFIKYWLLNEQVFSELLLSFTHNAQIYLPPFKAACWPFKRKKLKTLNTKRWRHFLFLQLKTKISFCSDRFVLEF